MLMFYFGGSKLDDLVIFVGQNYFGKGQYQIDDFLVDVGFWLEDGMWIQVECILIGKDMMGDLECKEYIVYCLIFLLIFEGMWFFWFEMFQYWLVLGLFWDWLVFVQGCVYVVVNFMLMLDC